MISKFYIKTLSTYAKLQISTDSFICHLMKFLLLVMAAIFRWKVGGVAHT